MVLDWVARFEKAPGRPLVSASALGLIQYNLGRSLMVLRRLSEAQDAFDLAHKISPDIPRIDAKQLSTEPGAHRSEEVRSRNIGIPAFQAA